MGKKKNSDTAASKSQKSKVESQKPNRVFAQYPKVNVLFVTSDDTLFFERTHALAHAKTLADKDVKELNRKDY